MFTLTAPELKQQGNAFFNSGSLVEAARCFTQAEITNSTDPVYPSNLSAALYEMGDYAASMDAIVRAWCLLFRDENQASERLAQRLSVRLAKALCHGARCGSITHAMVNTPPNQRAIAELSRKTGDGSVWDEWNVLVDGYGSDDWGEIARQAKISLSQLPVFRRAARPSREYFTIGQDNPMSLLDDWGPRPEYKSPIDLNTFPKSELKELSFLLGGAGDARHAYSTLIGAERAYALLPRSKRSSFQLHITLLDIHPAPLARGLCMMLLLEQLLNVGKNDAIEKAEILATIFYTYVAVVIPSYCEKRFQSITLRGDRLTTSDRLLSVMKDLVTRLAGTPPRLPAWIHVNAEAIDRVTEILRFWVDLPSCGESKTSDVLVAHELKTTDDHFEEALKNPSVSSTFRDTIRHNLDQARKNILDMIASGTPEQLAMTNLTPPPRSASAAVKREYEEHKKLLVDTMVEQSLSNIGDMGIEKLWYQITKVFMPPRALWSRHPRFESYQQMGFGTRDNPDPRFSQINSHIRNTWKPNWTLYDIISGMCSQLEDFDPFTTPISIREFNARFNIKPKGESRPLAFDHVSGFFQAAANALTTLNGRVTLEFICGDFIQELSKMKFNGDLSRPRHFPRSFTRIYLSNIPHVFLFALPAVKCQEGSFVTASSLLNTPIWKDDAEFIYTYTLLQPNDVERFLGCRFTGRSVVQDLTILGRPLQPRLLADLASRAELESWLIRTLIYTLAPGTGRGLVLRVCLPNNVVAFFALLVHLHTVGYPAHWLGELVQRMVANEITTSATPYRGCWPIPISDARRTGPMRRIRLDPWAPDFENILAVAGHGLPFHVRLPRDYEARAGEICTLEAITVACTPEWGRSGPWLDNTAALLFYRAEPGARSADDIAKDVAGILEGCCGPPPGDVYILTVVDTLKLPRVRWKMGKRRLERMRRAEWNMVAYRTDVGEPCECRTVQGEWAKLIA
ncbi:hypothetical protein BD779DRAFT_1677610 [Infundibulicybe gibba]|nr:hypothetical protein BD779DRAFT_1677610 [Infundibulicybe gibba]